MSIEVVPNLLLSLMWAMQANTAPAAFWALAFLLLPHHSHHRDAVRQLVAAELATAAPPSSPEGGHAVYGECGTVSDRFGCVVHSCMKVLDLPWVYSGAYGYTSQAHAQKYHYGSSCTCQALQGLTPEHRWNCSQHRK
jgi:hypothetical protein